MSPKEYQEAIQKYDHDIEGYAERVYWRLAEPGVLQLNSHIHGLTSEVGEIADALKKYLRDNKPIDRLNLIEECGDVLWYLTQILTTVESSVEEAMQVNIKKLETRYPNGFSESGGLERDVANERAAMENAQKKFVQTK